VQATTEGHRGRHGSARQPPAAGWAATGETFWRSSTKAGRT